MLYLPYIDASLLADLLFTQSLARTVQSAGAARPSSILVHGSGDRAEQLLEAQGRFPERTPDGTWQATDPQEIVLIDRATQDTNRTLVTALTDEGVSAVGVRGIDRGLLTLDDDGHVVCRGAGWLDALVHQHVLPVVAALVDVPGGGPPREVPGSAALLALAAALDERSPVAVFFLLEDQVLRTKEGWRDHMSLDEAVAAYPSGPLIRQVHDGGCPVLLTTVEGFYRDTPMGVRVGQTATDR